jgi:hypothetical protein
LHTTFDTGCVGTRVCLFFIVYRRTFLHIIEINVGPKNSYVCTKTQNLSLWASLVGY